MAKCIPTAMNLTSSVAASSSAVNSPIASSARGYVKLHVDRLDYQGSLLRQTQIEIPTPTQRRVLKDGKEVLHCSSAQGNLWQ